ncbi:hypothetical protein LTV02_19535 [Nocardia yamanashiensis]|uniref:hypothetical protein n=1 Tax=Nocardia yamanashiensis TaxID=209247 RepID=UPI00082FC3D3|nr:hypothetical protein [Nocardia yamanashiensis]UGT45446.1 hypothetical protein LTV02_19535 [Nocardia yamanashiensis]
MFAIVAAVLFALALLLELVDRTTTAVEPLVIAGLLGLALHLAGFSSRIPKGGQWRSRAKWGRRY